MFGSCYAGGAGHMREGQVVAGACSIRGAATASDINSRHRMSRPSPICRKGKSGFLLVFVLVFSYWVTSNKIKMFFDTQSFFSE